MIFEQALKSLLVFAFFYGLGAYPTGYLIAKSKGIDILNLGSGNPGATNISRLLGARAGLWTLVGDVSKGALGAWLATHNWGISVFSGLCAFFTVLGHCFSIPGRLRGGKGVATALGTLLVLQPWSALVALLVFAVLLTFTHIASLASLTASFVLLASNALLYTEAPTSLGVTLSIAVVILRHRSNVRRIIKGNERKFSFAKKSIYR